MFSLQLFGCASIEGPDGPLTGRAAQRHRLALLALLAATPRGLTRDKLIACLWPENDAERGRHSLSDSIYRINKALEAEAVLATGDELRLDGARLPSDVAAFRDALDGSQWERAAELYAGPFLDGFHLSAAGEFERWLDGERDRLARQYAGALEALAEERAARGDRSGAVAAWQRRAAQDRYDSRVAIRLMEALEAAGNRAGALQHARIHTQLLEGEFGAAPDPDVVALAERLRAKPAGSAPDANEPAGSAPDANEPAVSEPAVAAAWDERTEEETLSPTPPRPGIRPLDIAARTSDEGANAIAVLPFEGLNGDEGNAAFVNGIHNDLITALSKVGALTVISPACVVPYRDAGTSLAQIGRELGVGVLLEGGVQRSGDRVRINVRLSEAETGELLWGERYDRELTVGNIFAIQTDIVERIVASLEASLTAGERARISTPATGNLTAYQLVQQAAEAYDANRTGNLEAGRLLRMALEVDPDYAAAWAGLAYLYSWRPMETGAPASTWDSAIAFAERALDVDPDHGHAYTALAAIYGQQGHLDREARAARRALELNPNDHLAVRRLAQSYFDRGAFVEALRLHKASVRLSPNHRSYRSWVGHVYVALGKLQDAKRWYGSTLALHPHHWCALEGIALVELLEGRQDSALRRADQAHSLYPAEPYPLAGSALIFLLARRYDRLERVADRLAELALEGPLHAQALILTPTMFGFGRLRGGDSEGAAALFGQSEAFVEPMIAGGATAPRWPFEMGLIQAARGDTDRAMDWLERAYEAGFRWTWMLELNPMLDSLRDDTRFHGLLRRVKLDVEAMREKARPEARPHQAARLRILREPLRNLVSD